MSRWFRLYDDTLNDPKILKLSDKLHRVWIGILCVASKNNGELPPIDDIALMVRMKPAKIADAIESLIKAGLIDDDGAVTKPHNWDKRQFKSDVSTERVKRFRNAERNVSETPPETETETEQNTERKKDSRTVAKATRPKTSEAFDEFWKTYPRRLGANPRRPASLVFEAAVRQGAEPAAIVEGARRCAAADHDKIGTPYIPQAVKWLRDQRWNDYTAAPPGDAGLTDEQRRQMFEKLRGTNGQSEGKRTDLRGAGAGTREVKGAGRQEPATDADDQTRDAGMGRVDAIFRDAPGVRAGGDETSSAGIERRIYGTG